MWHENLGSGLVSNTSARSPANVPENPLGSDEEQANEGISKRRMLVRP
jgi:hypothetical protein